MLHALATSRNLEEQYIVIYAIRAQPPVYFWTNLYENLFPGIRTYNMCQPMLTQVQQEKSKPV